MLAKEQRSRNILFSGFIALYVLLYVWTVILTWFAFHLLCVHGA